MVIILFKFTWRRSFSNGYVLLKCSSCRKCVSSWVIAGQRFYAGYCAGWLSGGLFFSLYSLVAQHSISGYVVGMATRVCSMKRKRTLNSLTPLFHSCFIYAYLCLYFLPRLFLSVLHTYNYPHLFSAFRCLGSIHLNLSTWWTLFPLSHLAPFLFTFLSPAFCLSKGKLLVPYQTLMNYEGPLSSGLDRNTSHCLPASLLKQLRKERYCIPVRNTLFCRSVRWII